jgi:lysophospholipid acyltransferase (LPLAT)-like uncharacterized protein
MARLRDRLLPWLVGWAGALLTRFLYASWRIDMVDPEDISGGVRRLEKQIIVSFWHRQILMMMIHYRRYPVCVPVSRSRDGEYVAQAMTRYGQTSVRGSSSRGGITALRGVIEQARRGLSPTITPDGPKGPRYSVHPGIWMLARRTGLPVYPFGVAARNAWTAKSWDEFCVPLPGTRVVVAVGPGVFVEDYDDAESFCRAVHDALMGATETARRVAAPRA